eukprot:CAMPEP_0181100984 /NCGR_PEP_ID=MMETSP1071-20121207/13499_1 /TAXON_ID=35127 /ORGANISM="Thalassiosira sp., Strain NH16" /LENGTH=401 /DNA_ID=CAMNT_0023183779 /DNA_START=38 /DNA_END=1243 /DNA_ORIENTATION=+
MMFSATTILSYICIANFVIGPVSCFLQSDLRRNPRAFAVSATTRLHLSDGGEQGMPTSPPPRRAGRRSTVDRVRRPPPNRGPMSSTSRSSRNATSSASRRKQQRAPHQFDHTKADARPFLDDPAAYVKHQRSNADAPCYTFPEEGEDVSEKTTIIPDGSHFVSVSLDEVFPGLDFSHKFCSTKEFRDALRSSMREDVFDSTPAYAGMSEKARKMLLLPDSSLQGSWNCKQGIVGAADNNDEGGEKLRMGKLTGVLKKYLGENGPTGDEFMETIGKLCGSKPSTHWIDIVGITDRKISHSWHQDTGRSPGGDTRTVLLGFPAEDNYDGVGVFSHGVKLMCERVATEDHPPNEPIIYPGLDVDDKYIVKPKFAEGSEIIMFRDIDSLHSAPDVAYRASVMRFM